jgi:hypothetical protein
VPKPRTAAVSAISARRLYRSRLFELKRELTFKPPYNGRGWRGLLRPLTLQAPDYQAGRSAALAMGHLSEPFTSVETADGGIRLTFGPELLIEATSRIAAQRALNLVTAAKLVVEGGSSFLFGGDMMVAVPDDPEITEDLEPEDVEAALGTGQIAAGIGTAAALAARASHRRIWTAALVKYALSCRSCAISSADLHPHHGLRFNVAQDPYDYLAMSQAIFFAFSAFEDLGLKLEQHDKDKTGQWRPEGLARVKRNLGARKLNPDGNVVWHLRGTPTRIERRHAPPSGTKAPWAAGPIRDRRVPLPDAIHYAQMLRNKVSGHRVTDLTRSLTVLDVVNVRDLLRRFVLEGLGFWRRV